MTKQSNTSNTNPKKKQRTFWAEPLTAASVPRSPGASRLWRLTKQTHVQRKGKATPAAQGPKTTNRADNEHRMIGMHTVEAINGSFVVVIFLLLLLLLRASCFLAWGLISFMHRPCVRALQHTNAALISRPQPRPDSHHWLSFCSLLFLSSFLSFLCMDLSIYLLWHVRLGLLGQLVQLLARALRQRRRQPRRHRPLLVVVRK